MIIYYTGVDNGDGSLGVEFFDCRKAIDLLEQYDCERYRGEGGGQFACSEPPVGIEIQSMKDAEYHLVENLGIDKDFING